MAHSTRLRSPITRWAAEKVKGDVVKLTTNEKEISKSYSRCAADVCLIFGSNVREFFQNDMALNIFDPAIAEVSEKARERVQMGMRLSAHHPQNAAAAVGGNALKRGRGDDNIQVHHLYPFVRIGVRTGLIRLIG